jgi:hypothetical protein
VPLLAAGQEDDWGFDEDDSSLSSESETEPEPEAEPEQFWDLTGDLSLGTSYNYLQHQAATGTHYGNLQRLRTQLDLQLDVDLAQPGWKLRVEGYGFYDFAYLAHGRSSYTDDVQDDYEWEVDFREVWIQGSPFSSLDLKVGRQIVNWGRSDTLRVLDVINPLDNREPGLVDIEDLRLPVTMARVDYYPRFIPREYGEWSVQFLVIPEFRQDRNPSIGNDFNPTPIEIDLPSDKPDRFFADPEFGGQITGTFSGWDVSVYGARVYLNQPLISTPLGGMLQRFPMVTLVGAGGNLTVGSWLFKSELAWFEGLEYTSARADPTVPFFGTRARVVERDRLDAMGGVEYYGVNDLQIALEAVHRHIIDWDERLKYKFGGSPLLAGTQVAYAEENISEAALRVTADFFNTRLQVTAVGLIFVAHASNHLGSVVRVEANYELMEALSLGGGLVLYQEGDSPGLGDVGSNDRLFARIEYSF